LIPDRGDGYHAATAGTRWANGTPFIGRRLEHPGFRGQLQEAGLGRTSRRNGQPSDPISRFGIPEAKESV
jgi:hypothetical protein